MDFENVFDCEGNEAANYRFSASTGAYGVVFYLRVLQFIASSPGNRLPSWGEWLKFVALARAGEAVPAIKHLRNLTKSVEVTPRPLPSGWDDEVVMPPGSFRDYATPQAADKEVTVGGLSLRDAKDICDLYRHDAEWFGRDVGSAVLALRYITDPKEHCRLSYIFEFDAE